MAIKHLGKQQFLLCIENFLVIITVKIYTYLQKFVAQLVYKFDGTGLYYRKLPKLHGNSFYKINQNYYDDIVLSNRNGLTLLQQLFDDEIFFTGRKGIPYFNSFENREQLQDPFRLPYDPKYIYELLLINQSITVNSII